MTTALPRVVIPQLCLTCQYRALVRELHVPETGPWQVTLVALQVLLFQAAMVDERTTKRGGAELEDYTLVFAEIGCLACWMPAIFDKAIAVAKKDGGYLHAFAVAYGRAEDADWPIKIPKS